ncbi:MAG: hypothetical protein H7145_08165 [Akkermansiaceae bacterium]|nr:hypothetical protein [Armatimonadota bacterium]
MPETRANSHTLIEAATPFATATFGAGLFWRQWLAFGYYFYQGQTRESGTNKTV